jgi:acetoin utilization protein AcuB
MIAKELINQMIPPLKPKEKASKALNWMEELRTPEIPVIEGGKFLGLVNEEIILEHNDFDARIDELPLLGINCYVNEDTHFYNILKVASENQSKMVAVVNNLNEYQGVITIEDTLTAFAQTAAVQSPGAIIVISLAQNDYSLATISRLIEENEAKILSSCVTNDHADPSMIKLTLKINKSNLTHVIATLERFGYRIIARFQETGNNTNEKERWDLLMKYLSI